MQINKDGNVSRTQAARHLIQRGGFARAPLPVQHNHVVAMFADERLLNKDENVLAPKKHFRARNRIAGDIGIYRFHAGEL
ncbi:MAG: hypothetical protein HDKAJFGB_00642 [Anaerolineae bacterium]|nr:hypothetical protein [Anaerolineae bacterium]